MTNTSDLELSRSVAFASECCNKFHETILTFDSSHPSVHDLSQELEGLNETLDSLDRVVHDVSDSRLSLHALPLRQCGRACNELEQELLKHSFAAKADGTHFRHWKRLRYNGTGIEGFTQLLVGYKLAIKVALLEASLREPSLTLEELDNHKSLVQTAIDHIQACLDDADINHETIHERIMTEEEREIEFGSMAQERAAAESCIQVCKQLFHKLSHTRPVPQRIGVSDKLPKETTSVIMNHGTGDVFQVMVSADGRILHGTNDFSGWKGRQCGGHLSNFTTRQVSRDMSRTTPRHSGDGSRSLRDVTQDAQAAKFETKWGPGRMQ